MNQDHIVQALRVVTRPFLEQETTHLYFARSANGERYYVGTVPAGLDSTTGAPPDRQVCIECERLSTGNEPDVFAQVVWMLESQATTTIPRIDQSAGLLSAVLLVGQQTLIVHVKSNRIRRIVYKWHAKDATDVPPNDWLTAVMGECQFQETTTPPITELFRRTAPS